MTIEAQRRRNRLATGDRAVRECVSLSLAAVTDLDDAARDSGNLSISLYLERLTFLVKTEHGALPLLTDDTLEALKKPA